MTDLTDRIEFFARWAELVVYAVETKVRSDTTFLYNFYIVNQSIYNEACDLCMIH